MKTRILAFPGTSDLRINRGLSIAVLLTLALSGSAAMAQTAGSSNPTGSEPALAPDDSGYRQIAQPFFKKFCIGCHGPDLQEGEFRVDENLPNDFLNLTTKGHWGEVVNVLNSHEMPPEDENQPTSREVSKVVDWITEQMVRAELVRRDTTIVLRRLNRAEYRNTIRDLVGIEFDTAGFPQDPSSGGFDNNGRALTISPLHLELYYKAARQILDEAFVEGPQPPAIKWRFEIEVGDGDSSRVEYDGQRLIVHGAKNPVENGFKVIHHSSWDKNPSMRDFALKHGGDYIIRVRAGGRVPTRRQVVESAKGFLDHRMNEQMQKNSKGEKWHRERSSATQSTSKPTACTSTARPA
jgi:mono/diheme cytochrome c family protein